MSKPVRYLGLLMLSVLIIFSAGIPANQSGPHIASAYPGYGDPHKVDATISTSSQTVCTYGINQVLTTLNTQISCSTDPMRGFADIHNHQFANLAFGGKSLVGSAYGTIEEALSPSLDRGTHGPRHVRDVMGGLLATRTVAQVYYDNGGYPSFSGWPQFWEVSHQKVYQDWLYRAVQGGLRLMVMLAVDSPKLCASINNDGRSCKNEMITINQQLDAAYAMQNMLDEQAGGAGKGWYRIVTTPAEARRVIQEGKLAVVLGIETAHLFNCFDQSCAWQRALDYYWQRGVRHFFPIHQSDNVFGGTSYFQTIIQRQTNWFVDQYKRLLQPYEIHTRPCPQYDFPGGILGNGRCNSNGLTETGQNLVEELMRSGALIDVDHMSDRSFDDVVTLAQQYSYPIVASHAGFNEINNKGQDHEGQLTADELKQIHDLGGMVGLISGQGDLEEVGTYQRPDKHTVSHICGRTSETFAQAYYYVLDHAPGMSVSIGTDFNSPLAQPGPRFGQNQCFVFWPIVEHNRWKNRDLSKQKWEKQLDYPFLARGSFTRLDRYISGNRTFDFNYDGLAHIGLLPDFLADLEALEIPADDLEPLFRSAEGYVLMWEKAIVASNNLLKDGMLLRHQNGNIYLIYGGAKFHIPNPQIFDALGLDWAHVQQVPNERLAGIPTIPRDGTLLRDSAGTISVIYGGARFGIPNMDVYNSLPLDRANLRQVWDGALAGIPTIPRNGTVLREQSSLEVYLIQQGNKRHITSPEVLMQHGGWESVRVVPDNSLASFPSQSPLY